jgi:cytoskeletal protein RodZ
MLSGMGASPAAKRSPLLVAAVWLAGAVAAVGTGLVAVNLVASQVGDPTVAPLSRNDVGQALASPSRPATASRSVTPAPATSTTTATSATRGATTTPTRRPTTPARSASQNPPPAAPQTRTFSSRGGSVGVRCDGASPSLVYASPANGYTVLERRSDGDRVEVRFAKGGAEDEAARIRVGCVNGTPVRDTHG